MELVIVHYHLNTGGVTQVIRGHIRALRTLPPERRPGRIHLLFDGHHEGWEPSRLATDDLPVSLHPVPGLAYQTHPVDDSRTLARDIEQYLDRCGVSPDNSILHIHNPTLGKTASLPGAIHRLARRGYHLLLHPHDFAEDLRPDNYRLLADALGGVDAVPRMLYVHAPHLHWAVLNHRDLSILSRAGIPHQRLHWLPNPIGGAAATAGERHAARRDVAAALQFDPARMLLLYPVRGIRRKNVGELLLVAAMLGNRVHAALTLAPRNPRELPTYEHWVATARRCRLPVDLASSTKQVPFETQRAAADWITTTSVAEGFGLVFLETWLAGRPLAGRDLPEITGPFKESGIRFDGLDDALRFPVAWCGEDRVLRGLRTQEERLRAAYGRLDTGRPPDDASLQSLVQNGLVDFAHCDLELQTEIIESVAASAARRDELLGYNRIWERIGSGWTMSDEAIRCNAEAVVSSFGFPAVGARLDQIYTALSDEPGGELMAAPHPDAVLDAFLQWQRIHPIRLA